MAKKPPKQPKAPKPAALARPKTRDLRVFYKGLLTVSVGDRIATLQYALHWYQNALLYSIQKKLIPMSPDPKTPTMEQKRISLAIKARTQAQGTNQMHEKETALLTAVRCYEMALAKLRPVAVDKFYDLYKTRRAVLEEKQKRMELKFGTVFKLLQSVVGDRFKITIADAQKPRQYDPKLAVLNYNREAAASFSQQFRNEGFLPVLISQIRTFARNAALQPDGAGGFVYDAEKHLDAYDSLLEDLVKFSMGADSPKSLVRKGYKPQPPQANAPAGSQSGPAPAPRAPRTGPVGKRGPLVGGFLLPGTAVAELYERLKDEATHDVATAIVGLNTPDPFGRIGNLHRSAQKKGAGEIILSSDKKQVQFKHASGWPK